MWTWNSFQTDEAKIRRHKKNLEWLHGIDSPLDLRNTWLTEETEEDARVEELYDTSSNDHETPLSKHV